MATGKPRGRPSGTKNPPKPAAEQAESYQRHKAAAANRNREMAKEGRNIGEIPAIVDLPRRLRAAASLLVFLETYFPQRFYRPFCADQKKVIAKLQDAILTGGKFALAMPRGFGKTAICEGAVLWATLNGHIEFVLLLAATDGLAEMSLSSIKEELDGNELLAEDYPEACFPIAALEGISNRAKGQLYRDSRTHVEWTGSSIVLPALKPAGWAEDAELKTLLRPGGWSFASAAMLMVTGLTGSIRGLKHGRPDGRQVRPQLVLIDDPQTDDSARSVTQCATRSRIISNAVLGLAGAGTPITVVMPCTVIRAGDLADTFLDRKEHPEWKGEKMRLLYGLPTRMDLWDQYAEMRRKSFAADGHGEAAHAFYLERRAEMDEGAVPAWPECYSPTQASAVQYAMDLKIDRGDAAFYAEQQNDPLIERVAESVELSEDQITAKAIKERPRGEAPSTSSTITAFIDVQGDLLFWMVAAWEPNFNGHVLDYGAWPDQGRPYYYLREARPTISQKLPGRGLEGQLYGALEALTLLLLGREWRKDDGSKARVERCLIDASWGDSTDTVYQFAKETPFSALVTPSHGHFIGAAKTPMAEWAIRPGERTGWNWVLSLPGKRPVRHVTFDANAWKSFTANRLATAKGDNGCVSLFGVAEDHRLLAEHLTAEYRIRMMGRGREVDEWKNRPGRENHFWDCLVGCAVGASFQGCVLRSSGAASAPAQPGKTFKQMQAEARARKAGAR